MLVRVRDMLVLVVSVWYQSRYKRVCFGAEIDLQICAYIYMFI